MRRRAAIATLAAAAVGLAGCSRSPTDGDDAVAVTEGFDGTPDRPECNVESETVEVTIDDDTREYETAATIPYPDPPTEFHEDAIVDYVTVFEEAYVTHDVLCEQNGSGHILSIGYRAVAYAVDETGAARAEFDNPRDLGRGAIESEIPDPAEEGDLVAVFDR